MNPNLDAIGIVTSDLDSSLAFYRLLGLAIPEGAELGGPHVECATESGVRIMWDTTELVTSLNPDWTPPTGDARVALAFDCGNADEVDRVFERLAAVGHGATPPFNAPWEQRYAVCVDPDGNTIDLFAALS